MVYLDIPANSKEYHREYYIKHAEIIKARTAAWFKAHPDKAKAHWQQQNAKKAKGRPFGERNVNWKGDQASYAAIHIWVTLHKGRPSICEHCGRTDAKKYEWANVDHLYRRELSDWMRVCTSCHRRHDISNGLTVKPVGRKGLSK